MQNIIHCTCFTSTSHYSILSVVQVGRYLPDPSPLKNFRPWIQRTESGIDINLIINSNVPSPHSVLLGLDPPEAGLLPGIQYVAFRVDDLPAAAERLAQEGVRILRREDEELRRLAAGGLDLDLGVFIEDPDRNIICLVDSR